jgi:hypothetical protein
LRYNSVGWTFGLTYYQFPVSNCTFATCALEAAFSYSGNGVDWAVPEVIAGPMSLSSLATTSAGYMVGDYFTSVFPTHYITPLTIGVTPKSSFAYNEAIYMPLQWGTLGPSVQQAQGSSSGIGLSVPDSAALHTGAINRVFQPARLAPATHIHHAHHPM